MVVINNLNCCGLPLKYKLAVVAIVAILIIILVVSIMFLVKSNKTEPTVEQNNAKPYIIDNDVLIESKCDTCAPYGKACKMSATGKCGCMLNDNPHVCQTD